MSLKRPENDSARNCTEEFISLDENLNKRWLSSSQAAKYLSISNATLRNLASNGKIPYYKFGRRNRYCVYELDKMIIMEPRGIRK